METLLDHHLATFNEWLQAHFMPFYPGSHFCAVVTLLDQLDPEEYNWQQVWVILQGQSQTVFHIKLLHLFNQMKANVEFSRMVSKFLMDRD